jgi:hypothetical protein
MIAHRSRCSACGRSPLVGERLLVFASDRGERAICELCLPTKRAGAGTEVLRIERIRPGERRLNVERAA